VLGQRRACTILVVRRMSRQSEQEDRMLRQVAGQDPPPSACDGTVEIQSLGLSTTAQVDQSRNREEINRCQYVYYP
jgi:hypothetical protein